MASLETVSEQVCFGGFQGFYHHHSECTDTPMRFALYQPPAAKQRPVPVLWYLSGLTCTEENFTVKAGAQRFAAEHGLIIVAPDTSPRGANIEGEEDAYDFGTGAGFYLDATQDPWSKHYNMYSYVTKELPALVTEHFPARADAQGIFGHSMGGHGALTIALKNPQSYKSVSAFSPICAPAHVPWGQKAFTGYLGTDKEAWREYDATELIARGARTSKILIDQGDADDFLETQLKPTLLKDVCCETGQALELRMQSGYDHSYFFIASFIEDHIRFHAETLN
ncbi:MAG: S-formylglutathione hydrolase [Gammaproteobacteria bacterium]|nr:S-formylglutathione hydrolase [Gammaproteobacteria bacterium]